MNYFPLSPTKPRKQIKGSEFDATEGSLIITSADAKEDDGIYICVAKNDLNTITQSVYIRVKGEYHYPGFVI